MEKLEELGFIGVAEYIESPDWAESLDQEFITILVDNLLEQYLCPTESI
jgi:hypothetical protein